MIVTTVLIAWDYLPEVWNFLPQLTIGLKFCSALCGFIITASLLLRRARRWLRRRKHR